PRRSSSVTVKNMKARYPNSHLFAFCALLLILGCGATDEPGNVAPARKVAVSSNVNVDVESMPRRVFINASVSNREGFLELLLSHKGPNNKGYESILWADVDARDIYQALLLANAQAGSSVLFEPEFREAQGQTIKI